MVLVSRIQSFQILSLAGNAGNGTLIGAQPPIGPVDTQRLQQKLQARIRKLKEEDSNKGKGVTKEAQATYDSLKKLYVHRSRSDEVQSMLT